MTTEVFISYRNSFVACENLLGRNVLPLTYLLREVLKVPQEKVCYCSMSLYCIRTLYCHKLCLQDHNSGTRLTMKWYTLYLLYINVLPPFMYVSISVPTSKRMHKHIVKMIRSVHSNGFLFRVFMMEKAHESGGPLVTVESFHARP